MRDAADNTLAAIVFMCFGVGVLLLIILRFAGCWNVRIQEYRYCKRIGYEAYDAKRDTAYWAQYGMKP